MEILCKSLNTEILQQVNQARTLNRIEVGPDRTGGLLEKFNVKQRARVTSRYLQTKCSQGSDHSAVYKAQLHLSLIMLVNITEILIKQTENTFQMIYHFQINYKLTETSYSSGLWTVDRWSNAGRLNLIIQSNNLTRISQEVQCIHCNTVPLLNQLAFLQ